MTRHSRWPIGLALVPLLCLALPAGGADAVVECWRGWAYRIDGQTRTYTSPELLLTTKGPAHWQAGAQVTLYLLDRATGRIVLGEPPIVVVPFNPRSYYRDNLNYVDGEGAIVGSQEHLVFGLSHIPPPAAAIEKSRAYNIWACGLEGSPN